MHHVAAACGIELRQHPRHERSDRDDGKDEHV
jgi:hypothetical protein